MVAQPQRETAIYGDLTLFGNNIEFDWDEFSNFTSRFYRLRTIMQDFKVREYLVSKYEGYEAVFNRLEKLFKDIPCENGFHYRYPSAKQALEGYGYLVGLESALGLSEDYISKNNEMIAKNMRVGCYDQAKVTGLFSAFINVKSYAIKDLCGSMVDSLDTSSILPSIVLARPIIENAASLALVDNDLSSTFQDDKLDKRSCFAKLQKINEVVTRRGKGTRIDWNEYFSKSLREGKKKSYKPDEGVIDLTASELMSGVDKLDKKIKGVRKLYEFLSEFAHPNVGLHNLYIRSVKNCTLSDGIVIWDRLYDGSYPTAGLDMFQERMLEVYEITCDVIEYNNNVVNKLISKKGLVDKWLRVMVYSGVRNHPYIFVLKEICPCFSGKFFRDCCGVRVQKKHKKYLGKT